MTDAEALLRKAVADALDGCGLAPETDDEAIDEFLAMLKEAGYVVSKIPEAAEE